MISLRSSYSVLALLLRCKSVPFLDSILPLRLSDSQRLSLSLFNPSRQYIVFQSCLARARFLKRLVYTHERMTRNAASSRSRLEDNASTTSAIPSNKSISSVCPCIEAFLWQSLFCSLQILHSCYFAFVTDVSAEASNRRRSFLSLTALSISHLCFHRATGKFW